MVTRTDFYLGTGPSATWLGSLQFGCHPDNLLKDPHGRAALTARQPTAYREAVRDLLLMWAVTGLGAAHEPRNGWPWDWDTSHRNDWIITHYDGAVHMTAGGGDRWHRLDPDDPCPPLRCGPPDVARWLCDPGAPPALRLPTFRTPGVTDPVSSWQQP
ncbi:hypothetical protein ACFQ05_26455 [Amycolatopsis umgeniensis]|uniref:Uncharacterized protein n=1 Tax=Amycolatopsis umgeniensis TaxID=336628 RepID=A0A841BD48_9PSEU|nr:hypothetical protein [Amycolatopsis umgeniensis]MBB5856424.1 hypothetical protein [Amycolatopsis umgeniensis]